MYLYVFSPLCTRTFPSMCIYIYIYIYTYMHVRVRCVRARDQAERERERERGGFVQRARTKTTSVWQTGYRGGASLSLSLSRSLFLLSVYPSVRGAVGVRRCGFKAPKRRFEHVQSEQSESPCFPSPRTVSAFTIAWNSRPRGELYGDRYSATPSAGYGQTILNARR